LKFYCTFSSSLSFSFCLVCLSMLISIFICSYVYLSICLFAYFSYFNVCSSFLFLFILQFVRQHNPTFLRLLPTLVSLSDFLRGNFKYLSTFLTPAHQSLLYSFGYLATLFERKLTKRDRRNVQTLVSNPLSYVIVRLCLQSYVECSWILGQ
jgi:hypothetical protein